MAFQVQTEKCDQCLFGPNRIVPVSRMRAILASCKRDDGHFICHKSTVQGGNVCCRGFYDANPEATNLMRIAARLKVIRFVKIEDETG